MPRKITSATSLDTLKREAKRWLKSIRANDADARARLSRAFPGAPAAPTLRDVQHALAREHGLDGWIALKAAVEKPTEGAGVVPDLESADEYGRLAQDLVQIFDTQDQTALDRVNTHYQRSFTFDDWWAEIWRRVYAFRQRRSKVPKNYLQLSEAQMLIAQDVGFNNWDALTRSLATGAAPVPAFAIDTHENRISPSRALTDHDWNRLLDVVKERKVTALNAIGLMTDSVLARVATLEHVTSLSLGGSRELTDDGLQHLARMPQLTHLNLSEYPGGKLTDRGLDVLRHLPNLRFFEMTWQRGITDAGVANLKHCDRLEHVDLMGTPTGDGTIEALQGKPRLRYFSTGTLVTDAGLRFLHGFPTFQAPQEGESIRHLLIDGPFTDAGLASLAGLDGVEELDLFWHVSGITSDGFAHLATLPNLTSLGADGELSDNVSMRHMAAIPRLRTLRAQNAVATDEGFEALSRSRTLEKFWGRECPGLGSRSLLAFSTMPSLQNLGVGLKNVDEAALASLPRFPALRDLTPIDVQDDGFRQVGRCERLERLVCMYCRDTTDIATGHIANLHLTSYYAGLTKITDRSLEILGGMASLERIELFECQGVTDAGLAFLAQLPRLREVHLDSLPGVTFAGTGVFRPQVRVKYST